jgi:hypothetical protein
MQRIYSEMSSLREMLAWRHSVLVFISVECVFGSLSTACSVPPPLSLSYFCSKPLSKSCIAFFPYFAFVPFLFLFDFLNVRSNRTGMPSDLNCLFNMNRSGFRSRDFKSRLITILFKCDKYYINKMLIYIQSRELYFIILHGLNLASDHTRTHTICLVYFISIY